MAARQPSTDPVRRVERWLAEATRRGAPQPIAMALATTTRRGAPSVRYVLLRGIDGRGFVFYTDARSRKGREIAANPRASLSLYWDVTGKQVRIDGTVEDVEPALADAYWASRPRGHRLAASASHQSAPLAHRQALLDRALRLRALHRGDDVPRPAYWTGFRVVPEVIEFWSRRPNRLHVRELFTAGRGGWRSHLLQP